MINDFITPVNIDRMDDAAIDRMLTRIREDRLKAYHVYLEAEKMKMLVRQEKLRKKLEQHVRMLNKELERTDKALEALNKRVNNIRAIQLELGDL